MKIKRRAAAMSHRYGLVWWRSLSHEKKIEALRPYLKKGWSNADICEKFGLESRNRVAGIRDRWNQSKDKKRPKPQPKKKVSLLAPSKPVLKPPAPEDVSDTEERSVQPRGHQLLPAAPVTTSQRGKDIRPRLKLLVNPRPPLTPEGKDAQEERLLVDLIQGRWMPTGADRPFSRLPLLIQRDVHDHTERIMERRRGIRPLRF